MGLTTALARFAARHPHVLVVEAPGAWEQRATLEHQALRRGWRLADSPADADVLAICGPPGPELTEAIDRVWEQLPGPRVRLDLGRDEIDVDEALDRASAELTDTGRHRTDARQRTAEPEVDTGDDMDMGEMDHDDMDMHMSPSGIALAEGGDDRDGLEMDVLHVHLGPVLRHWPAGLVVRCSLQGDLIVDAEAWAVDAEQSPSPTPPFDARIEAARECDRLVSLIALAGWPHGATQARRVRDLLLVGDAPADAQLHALRRTVTRSRTLQWSLRGVTDGHLRMLDRAQALLADSVPPGTIATTALSDVPQRIIGRELATARLVIAGLETLEPSSTTARRGGTHG
ncbi:hypothetical protein TUM20985_28570 [Mycobacterium antarcticum]|uniref:hypothetical protein n=1 Tax=unclassified Mycolicibacterium TaxID=2636767 RepID=UPI0023842361|nr:MULTISPECIES: hypothetical protein [unclassified Mycolicibacterium]BDX32310.1 hypothetical protein TUM20985_28570 [Mycolicibacterium sp. TUM20985]GLP84144.1 hypothetical protein TUM20984_55640 [Mycolicibacterium sp. TUM20984]